jgi:hypothetical protein
MRRMQFCLASERIEIGIAFAHSWQLQVVVRTTFAGQPV